MDIVNVKDRHVLDAARHHHVDYVITDDARLRQEIRRWADTTTSCRRPPAALSADNYTARLVHEDAEGVQSVIAAMAARFRNPQRSEADVLQTIARYLPSLNA